MCDKIGGHLPQLFSRSEHEELVIILTTYSNLIVPEGIFISLRVNSSVLRYSFIVFTGVCLFTAEVGEGGGEYSRGDE